MGASQRATISAMMRTCRTLYHTPQSSRILLQDGIMLQSDGQVVAFSRFMLASPTTRFHHLRALTFAKGNFSDEAIHAIKELLAHPSLSIDTLVLHDAERVVGSGYPQPAMLYDGGADGGAPLVDSFARLDTLKHLVMDGIDVCAAAVLEMLPSRLVSASLEYSTSVAEWSTLGHGNARNPIIHLVNLADTLEVLTGSEFDLPPAVIMYDVVYPRVRKIQASFADCWLPSVVAYAHSYPNLEHLVLTTSNSRRGRGPMCAVDSFMAGDLEPVRRTNREDQAKYGSWKGLRLLEGALVSVYALGLVCNVPELRLAGDVTRDTIRLLDAVLCDVRPECLSLTAVGGFMFDEGSQLTQLLANPEVQCMTSLGLELCFAPSEGDRDMAEITNNILRSLAGLPLRRLELTLNYGLLTNPCGPPSWWPQISTSARYYCPAAKYLAELDLDAYASRFGEMIPTLESVLVFRKDDPAGRRYLLGPRGRDSRSPSPGSSDNEVSIDPELAELGFGGMLDDEDDYGW
ncbi:hypothetical protein GY45DRAFT_1245181 [Cubamyces sp. BRFM 1775]|nr:hypothetical protein GY45DRAFT_1245181 [Cubamyces sp. BRFM 1775]